MICVFLFGSTILYISNNNLSVYNRPYLIKNYSSSETDTTSDERVFIICMTHEKLVVKKECYL